MQHAFLTRHDLDDRAEAQDITHGAFVFFAFFGDRHDTLDDAKRGFRVFLVGGGHRYVADAIAFFDLDLGARFPLDALNDLATGPDDGSDKLGVDRDLREARRVGRHFAARLVEHLGHLVEDVQPAFAGLVEGAFEDLLGQTGHLDVHLAGRDPGAAPRHLEVHVAEVILGAQDVAEHGDATPVRDEPHRHAGDRRFDRHAGVHHGQCARAHGRHGGRAVGLQHIRVDADRVREIRVLRHDGRQGAFGEVAVADLAPAGAAEHLGLACTKRREVVVQEEPAIRGIEHLVDRLGVFPGAERDGGHHLRFTAGKDRRTVDAGQIAHFRPDVTNLHQTASVEPAPFRENHLPHHVALDFADGRLDLGGRIPLCRCFGARFARFGVVGTEKGAQRKLLDLADTAVECFLQIRLEEDRTHFLADQRGYGVDERLRGDDRIVGDRLRFPERLDERVLPLAQFLDCFMADFEGLEHGFFRNLLHLALDHHDRVGLAGDDQVDLALRHLLERGVDDKLAVDEPNAYAGRRTVARGAGKSQGGGSRYAC